MGFTCEQKINRILLDDGSAVNILLLKTMKELGVPLDEMMQSRLLIQGFNQGGQRALGKLRLQLFIGDMESHPLFHVIDAKTTYNMLLGRPWIHQNGVVSSTLHQCFKYYRNGQVKTIIADAKPFTSIEAHFMDAKFYVEGTFIEEVMTAPVKELKQKEKISLLLPTKIKSVKV